MVKKMTNLEMVTAVNNIVAMQEREAENHEKIFGNKIKVSYAIKKNKEKLLNLLKPYEESRKELLEECNKKEAQLNGEIDIRNDCKERWKNAMVELQKIEVDVNIHTVKFADIEGAVLSVSDMEAIDFMLEAPEGFTE